MHRQLLFFGKILLFSGLIGAVISALRPNPSADPFDLVEGALCGILIGLGCTATEYFLGSNRRQGIARRLPIAALILIRAFGFSFFIIVGLVLPIWLISGTVFWREPSFATVFVISVVIASTISIGIEITRLLGSEATLALFTGRYRRPRLEYRVVLFADIVDSTALAERIGDLRFHEFLSDVAIDLAAPVERARGVVHRYVGDEVIVTWRLSQKNACDRSLACANAMHAALDQVAERYVERFALAPKLRISIHCGQVAAGEIGDWKKEIALLGDTMNTAARIEGAARDFGARTVLSHSVANRLSQEAMATLSPLPAYAAKGKGEDLALWRIA